MFSPYYAWANAKAPAAAENYCAMNMVLYEPRGGYWAMTERKKLSQGVRYLQIGPSRMQWDDGVLTAEINEMTVPVPRRLRGRLRLKPQRMHTNIFNLDAAGRHRWQPIAPRARIEVMFEKPELSWSGVAYFDSNDGDVPLAEDFSTWNWSRADGGGDAKIFYDVQRRDGTKLNLALQAGDAGMRHIAVPPLRDLAKTRWRVARHIRADAGAAVEIIRTLEDAPFYARSLIRTELAGRSHEIIHEALDLNRFTKPWVKCLLPFRMPRF